jgi:DNA-binding NtrC family response regulator
MVKNQGVCGMPKVLVIDDDEITLALMHNILEEEGYSIFSTADGPQGIQIYKEREPDVVILDLALPSMNGLEVLRKLKRHDPDAKIIVVTGHGSEESAKVALRYGAWGYIEKPVDFATFLHQIRTAAESA